MKRSYGTVEEEEEDASEDTLRQRNNDVPAKNDGPEAVFNNPVFVGDDGSRLAANSAVNTPNLSSSSSSRSRSTTDSSISSKAGSAVPAVAAGTAAERAAMQLQSRKDKNATSEFSAFFNLLKANIGTGMLALPQAFYYAGVWVALALTPFIGVIAVHCMHLLLDCSRRLCKRTNKESLNYEESVKAAFRTGPLRLRPMANFMTVATKTFIVVTQIGFCCVYYEFVAENLYQVVECSGSTRSGLELWVYKLILFLPFVMICSATELKIIGYMSITSCALFVVTIAIILYYCLKDLTQYPVNSLPAFGGWDTLPLYFGTVVFAIEGIGCMLPIENRMADPSNFSGPVGVLNTCMAIVICVYIGVGFFGYERYTSDVQGAITLNLPSNEVLAQAAKGLVSVAVFLSYPIQLYVVAQLFTKLLLKDTDSRWRVRTKNYAVRIACVTFTLITSLALPNVGLFISLVGAVSGAMMCLILPPIVHLVALWPDGTPSYFVMAKAVFIVGFGLLGSVVGSVTSIKAIIDFYSSDDNQGLQCSSQ